MTKLIMEPTRDCTGTMMQSFRSPKGGNLTFADLHNYLVRTFGGGVYLAFISNLSLNMTQFEYEEREREHEKN